MATHPSAEKRARQNKNRRARARMFKGKLRAEMRKVDGLLQEGKIEEALKERRDAESAIAKAASKGVIKKRAASRIISRLTKRIGRAARTTL